EKKGPRLAARPKSREEMPKKCSATLCGAEGLVSRCKLCLCRTAKSSQKVCVRTSLWGKEHKIRDIFTKVCPSKRQGGGASVAVRSVRMVACTTPFPRARGACAGAPPRPA